MKICDVCNYPVDEKVTHIASHVVINCGKCEAIQIYSSLMLGKYVRDAKNQHGENGHVYELLYPLVCSECGNKADVYFHKICMPPRMGYERYKLAVKDNIKPQNP